MENLLSNKWDNAFLNQTVQDCLLVMRHQNLNTTEEQFNEITFCQSTPFYLVDNKIFNKFNTSALVVENSGQDIVLMVKDNLINELNKYSLPDTQDVNQQVLLEMKNIIKDVRNDNCVKIAKEDFVTLLEINKLSHITQLLNLDHSPKVKSMTM